MVAPSSSQFAFLDLSFDKIDFILLMCFINATKLCGHLGVKHCFRILIQRNDSVLKKIKFCPKLTAIYIFSVQVGTYIYIIQYCLEIEASK